MSLHTLAQHLQSAGRGQDSVLVHMTPREVQSLQTLAMAHGGSLTINPQTGLPEAGFLSALLPMVAGAFLGPAGANIAFGGLSSAASVGLLTAGIGTLATGSLGKGLMMGLGAYGGAGLGAAAFGPGAAAQQAAKAATMASGTGASGFPINVAASEIPGASVAAIPQITPQVPLGLQAATTGAGYALPQVPAGAVVGPNGQLIASNVNQLAAASAPSVGTATEAAAAKTPGLMDRFQQFGGKLFSGGTEGEEARKKFLEEYKMPLLASGVSALALSQDEQKMPQQAPGQPIRPSRTYTGEYAAGPTPGLSGERQYTFFAEGGLADLPVEKMSQEASTGANTNYPMANIRPYGYAVPRNVPISENVFKPMDYQRTDPYTGEQRLAGGGIASLATGGFISKLKPVAKPPEPKPRLQSTAALDKQIANLEKYSDLGGFQGQVDDLKSQLAELNKNRRANAKPIADLNRQLGTATAALNQAKAYQSAVAARDKMVAANEAVTAKAQATYDAAMEKYNAYQDALAAEKQAWQEETGRKATGVQALRPQSFESAEAIQNKIRALQEKKTDVLTQKTTGPVGEVASKSSVAEIDKQIAALNAQLKTAGQYKPLTKFAYDPTTRLMEENDIRAIFEDVAGRRPTAAEMDRFLGTRTSDAAIATFATKLPDVMAKMSYTDDDLRENWQYYTGREPTGGELAAMKKAKPTNFNQLRDFIKGQSAFLENVNKLGLESITAATKLPVETIATAFKDVLGRQPTLQEIEQYSQGQTQQSLVEALKQTPDYKQKFVRGLIPQLNFEKYAPGTVLEYKPTQQAQTGLGTIGGLMPTPSGMQTPQTRGPVTIQGAMPLNPTFQEQLGLQTLAAQAAETAPALQRGLRFDLPTAAPAPGQLMPGLTGLPQPPQQQNYEQQLANIGEKQIQPAAAQSNAVAQPGVAVPVLASANAAPVTTMAMGGYAGGGYHLGDYSDGGRLLKGPGDGVSDSIPASIGNRQPARLADGEFVIPARIVSELGNGSTDAGARKLYAMMDRIQRARRKSVGRNRVAVDSKAEKLLPA